MYYPAPVSIVECVSDVDGNANCIRNRHCCSRIETTSQSFAFD